MRFGPEQGPCLHCTGLSQATRSTTDPHEYLVKSHSADAQGADYYQCLVCKSELTRIGSSRPPTWKLGWA